MTVHQKHGRTQYFDDQAAKKGIWPFMGCFGPWLPKKVKYKGEVFTRIDGLRAREYRGVYKTSDHSKALVILRDCRFKVL